jgi:hypothetical protein
MNAKIIFPGQCACYRLGEFCQAELDGGAIINQICSDAGNFRS